MRPLAGIVCVSTLAMLACAAPTTRSDPHVATSAPEDRTYHWDDISKMDAELASYVAQARVTYPDAKSRFQSGLPPQHSFFVTVDLRDSRGKVERVFLVVDRISSGTIYGRIWNDVLFIEGFQFKQPHSVREAEILDWTITRPDGTEEGNYVGKYIDTLQDSDTGNQP